MKTIFVAGVLGLALMFLFPNMLGFIIGGGILFYVIAAIVAVVAWYTLGFAILLTLLTFGGIIFWGVAFLFSKIF